MNEIDRNLSSGIPEQVAPSIILSPVLQPTSQNVALITHFSLCTEVSFPVNSRSCIGTVDSGQVNRGKNIYVDSPW